LFRNNILQFFPETVTGHFSRLSETRCTDAILQMRAAFVTELAGNPLPKALLAQAATPAEANMSHRLFTAALQSAESGRPAAWHPPHEKRQHCPHWN